LKCIELAQDVLSNGNRPWKNEQKREDIEEKYVDCVFDRTSRGCLQQIKFVEGIDW
jgi:hypothetical protein